MAALFRGKFLARLVDAHRRGVLVGAGPSAALAEPLAWQQLVTQLRAKAWYVYAKAPFAGPKQVLNYLARYTHRIAISNERLVAVEHDQVRFRYKDYAAATAPSPAERILQLTGVDILRCPVCGEGPMRRIERLPPDTS